MENFPDAVYDQEISNWFIFYQPTDFTGVHSILNSERAAEVNAGAFAQFAVLCL